MPLITPDPIQDRALGESLVSLTKSGQAPPPQSPAGAALLSAYRRWQAQQNNTSVGNAVEVAVKATAAE
ncbi:MAG TPA: hypothetical protein VMB82_12950, partial [Acidimicrobiales bacterium]|nr:hypothetical protein [Acidimicrobiales bacterium]